MWAWAAGLGFVVAFTTAVWLLGDRLADVGHAPDQGASDYYWKLTQPTAWTRALVWSIYAAHQLLNFAILFWAQRARPATGTGLHRFNVAMLAVNAVFVLLHLVQTHVTYDGLAQDVSVFSSLGAVAVLLIWVLLIETPRRGLFFGWAPPLPGGVVAFARRWHGYYFSWAIVYTFWFHPTEPTRGHLIGFFYLLMIMLQGSLFFTRMHVNRWWTLALEVLVCAHGTLVAIDQGAGLWAMFFFGFSALFIVTQMHGLGWGRGPRLAIAAAWLAGVAAVYGRQPGHLEQVARIPLIDYLGVFVLTGLFAIGMRIMRSLR